MRGLLLIAALLTTGCVTPMRTTTTVQTRRIAFTSLPTAPPMIQGSGGVALRSSFLPGNPVSLRSDGALAFPMFQPELGALVKVGKGTYVGGRFAISTPTFGVQAPPGSLAPKAYGYALDVTAGAGHDFRFTELFGLSLSGELGLTVTSVTRSVEVSFESAQGLPVGRSTLGVFFTPGKFRIYAGGTLGSTVLNDATGTLTTTCQFDCVTTETGRVDLTLMGMVGAGVRYQASERVSLTAEAWLPISELQRMPPVLSLTLRVGDLGNSEPPPRPLPPPPPPPNFTPDPELPAPQL